ncbi:hypothetical protein SDC9_190215 [bioreactor metagenome]|uniref:Uncharacterized protein n=1 Tax=bioreactor metagenome TaxID=1076179 RepID=A0A645HUE9_9ZZZZ
MKNIVNRNACPIAQNHHSLVVVNLFYRAGDAYICAAGFLFVWDKVGDGHLSRVGQPFLHQRQPLVDCSLFTLVQLDAPIRHAGGFLHRRFVAGQRGKGRKLRCTVQAGHGRMLFGNMVRQKENIVVRRVHALCPPICPLRWMAVAPSCRLAPFRMAFLPYFS